MKKVTFLLATLLIGSMMLVGCKKDQPTPEPTPTSKTKTVEYQVRNESNGLVMSDCFKLSVTYIDANGESVTEDNVTLPWKKTIEVNLPFHAKMNGTFSYNDADLPEQVFYGRYYGIGYYNNNSLVITLTGGIQSSSKEVFLNNIEQHPDRLQFTEEMDF